MDSIVVTTANINECRLAKWPAIRTEASCTVVPRNAMKSTTVAKKASVVITHRGSFAHDPDTKALNHLNSNADIIECKVYARAHDHS